MIEARQARRARAVALVKELDRELRGVGVEAMVIGSLAKGGFTSTSDIDLLVMQCPAPKKYRIEGLVEDTLVGFKFDVVYLDEIPPHRIGRFMEGAVHASSLR